MYKDAAVNFFHADPTADASSGSTSGSPMVKCPEGLAYGTIESEEQGDALPGGRKRLLCTHVQAPKPPVRTFNAFLAMYNDDGRVMWAKGNIAATSAITCGPFP